MKIVPGLILAASYSINVASTEMTGAIEPAMVSIPSGTFVMGSDNGQANEKPVREVEINAFMMGKYEVTITEFERFIEATKYPMPQTCVHEAGPYWFLRPAKPEDNSVSTSGNEFELAVTKGSWDNNAISQNKFEPVVCVGWKAAHAYAAWLRKETGKPYRLPTEAEWEYASRAGTDTPYFFGDRNKIDQICRFANVADKFGEEVAGKLFNAGYGGSPEACNDKSGLVNIVGMYQPNAFGLYDTLGNVEEWVQDCYSDNPTNETDSNQVDEADDCKLRVIRGGSWHYQTYTVSQRTGREQDDFIGVLEGFRLALDGQDISPATSTLSFEKNLHNAQKQRQHKMDALLDFPQRPAGLKVSKNDENDVVLSWNKNTDNATSGYDIYRSTSYFDESHNIARHLTNETFVDDKPVHGRVWYSIRAVNSQRKSQWSDPVVIGQSEIHSLPGKIQAEAYFSAPNSIIAASVSEPQDDRGYLRIANANADYQIAVGESATYEITLRIFNSRDSQPIEIWLEDKLVASILPTEEQGWQSVSKTGVHIAKGQHLLSIKSRSTDLSINWLEFTRL